MCILKNSEGQFPIKGFWIFRGQDIPQMMKDECYDLELYDWKKLDGAKLEPVSPSSACSTQRRMYLCVLICDVLGICDVMYYTRKDWELR